MLATSSGVLFFETTRVGSTCPSQNVRCDVIALQRPARAEGCLLKLLIGKLSTKHDLPQCGMANLHGENPGAVSILQGDDRGDMDHSELCSVKVSRCIKKWTLLRQLAMRVSAT